MTGPLILIVIGVLLLLNNLYPDVYRFSRMWPVILIAIGASKVFDGWMQRTNRGSSESSESSNPRKEQP